MIWALAAVWWGIGAVVIGVAWRRRRAAARAAARERLCAALADAKAALDRRDAAVAELNQVAWRAADADAVFAVLARDRALRPGGRPQVGVA